MPRGLDGERAAEETSEGVNHIGTLHPGNQPLLPLEKGKALHSSILAWRMPWTV